MHGRRPRIGTKTTRRLSEKKTLSASLEISLIGLIEWTSRRLYVKHRMKFLCIHDGSEKKDNMEKYLGANT